MNDGQEAPDRFDPGLEDLFRRTHGELADGTFVATTMRRVRAEKARRRRGRRLAEAAGLIAIVLASPWLIEASVRLSTLVDQGLALALPWLATPAGMAAGLVIVVAVALLRPLIGTLARALSGHSRAGRQSGGQ